MIALLALGVAVAAVSAVRGVWSPCGLSMLSSITPMTEAGRGNRFGRTAGWFLVGGIAGGLSLGLVAALAASGVAALDLDVRTRWAVAAVAALGTAAVDLGLTGVKLPIFKRQVNDAWLRSYRSWVYGAGFGWQIGFGVATYIMTAGVLLTILLAVLTASPPAALLIGATFGLVRGSAVFLGRSATSPDALARVHERLEAWGPRSAAAAIAVQLVAAGLLALLVAGPAVGALVAAAALAVVALTRRTRSTAALS